MWHFPWFCSSCWEIPKPHSHIELRHASQCYRCIKQFYRRSFSHDCLWGKMLFKPLLDPEVVIPRFGLYAKVASKPGTVSGSWVSISIYLKINVDGQAGGQAERFHGFTLKGGRWALTFYNLSKFHHVDNCQSNLPQYWPDLVGGFLNSRWQVELFSTHEMLIFIHLLTLSILTPA